MQEFDAVQYGQFFQDFFVFFIEIALQVRERMRTRSGVHTTG